MGYSPRRFRNQGGRVRLETIPTAAIVADNYREAFDPDALRELADSIAASGLAMPPTVEPHGDGTYLLVDGERRLRACRDILGWETIPATIREAMSTAERLALQLTANVSRRDTLPYEDGAAILAMMDGGETLENVARRIGKGARWCRDRVDIARGCSPATCDAIRTGIVGVRLAATLSRLDHNRQRIAVAAVVSGDLTPSELAAKVDKLAADQSAESVEAFAFAIEEWTEAKRVTVARESAAADTMPLGRTEIAEMLGVRTATVGQWITRDLLPPPDGRISGSPVWHRETVTAWAIDTGRMGA